jgi:hypothetical protein
VKNRTDDIDRVLNRAKTVRSTCEGTQAHMKEMQRLRQLGQQQLQQHSSKAKLMNP